MAIDDILDDMQNIVYYFSGTGNSYFVARAVAKTLDCRCIDLATGTPADKINADKIVIVFPSYAYGAPKPVLRFLKHTRLTARYIAVAVTCGSSSGGTLHSVRRVLKRRKTTVSYFAEIVAPENFIPIFGAPQDAYLKQRLTSLESGAKQLAGTVEERGINWLTGIKPLSALISALFLLASPLLALFSRINRKKCTGCGLCEKSCPCGAIVMTKKSKVKIKKTKCAICQRCFNVCPQKCITFCRLTEKSGRYFHPGVNLKDITNKSGE